MVGREPRDQAVNAMLANVRAAGAAFREVDPAALAVGEIGLAGAGPRARRARSGCGERHP